MTRAPHRMVLLAAFALLGVLFGHTLPAVRADDAPTVETARRLASEGDLPKAIETARAAWTAAPADLASARLLQDLLRLAGRTEEGTALLDASKAETPEARDATTYLRTRAGSPTGRIKGFRELREDPEASAFAHLDLAWAYLDADRAREAEAAVKAYLKRAPLDAEGHEVLGRAELGQGSDRAARESLERALALDPGRWNAVILLADVLHLLREAPRARVVLLEAVERYGKNLELQLGLAQDQIRTGELPAAEKGLDQLLVQRPRDLRVLLATADAKRKLGKIPETEALARRVLALDEDHARGHEMLGFALEKQGKLEEALEHYFLAVRGAPEWPDAQVGVAFVQILLGELEYAEQAVKRAFKLDRNHPGAHLCQGILEYLADENRNARKHFELVLKKDAKSVPAHRYMGYVLLDDGKAKAALEHFEAVMELDPSDAGAMRMAGRIYLELGEKVEKAVEILKRAVELAPNDPWTHFDLGKAHEEEEEFEEAAKAYRKAIELEDTFTWPHLYLAELLDEVEREFRNALVHYKRFLELGGPDPDEEIAKRIKVIEGN